MNCNGCLELFTESCKDISLDLNLAPHTEYDLIVRRPEKDTLYKKRITTGNDGKIVIEKVWYPAGYFASGFFFKIEVRDTVTGDVVPVVTGRGTFYCVMLETVSIVEVA